MSEQPHVVIGNDGDGMFGEHWLDSTHPNKETAQAMAHQLNRSARMWVRYWVIPDRRG